MKFTQNQAISPVLVMA